MSKTFKYFKKTGEIYDKYGEWDGDDGFEFEYEVDDERIIEALAYFVNCDYFENKVKGKFVKSFIKDFDLNCILEECYEEDLKDYFEEDALASLD